ncbi:aprataxin-like [Liolophura sinensis]|uniref:aprataxin-like n=1 Tax=Liolophura sinensis TaxID=3198878 RepID=UPI003158E159
MAARLTAANKTAAAMASAKRKATDVEKTASAPKKPFGHWSQGLLASMDDPELRVDADDKVVIIKDKYPKARHHFLILPKQKIASLRSLKKDHLELLEHVHKKGEELAKKTCDKLNFRLGYHAIPSMSHLHMHVISQDFDSPSLKNKKHWNSFTTEYFVDSKDIIKRLKEDGKVDFDSSKFQDILKRPLKCHVCKKDFSTIPSLKTHIKLHVTDGSVEKKAD